MSIAGFRALSELAHLGAADLTPEQLAARALEIALAAVSAEAGELCLLEGVERRVIHAQWPEPASAGVWSSRFSAPIASGGRAVGVLDVAARRAHRFDEEAVGILTAIGAQLGPLLDHARVRRQAEQRAQLGQKLRELGEHCLMLTDVHAVQGTILAAALEIAGCERGLLSRMTPDGRTAQVRIGIGKNQRLVGVALPIDAPYLKESLSQPEPLVVEDTSILDPNTVIGHAAAENGTRSFVLATMRLHDRPLGHILIASDRTRRWDPEEIEAIQTIAGIAAGFITHAEVQEELESERRRLALAIEHLPLVIAVVSGTGERVHVNAAARAFAQTMGPAGDGDWRHAMAQLRYCHTDGRPIQPPDLPIFRAFAGESPPPMEIVLSNGDGTKRFTVLGLAAPLQRDAAGQVTEVVAGFQDVSALRDLADAKDQFLRIASHELRSPITSLRATTSLLELDPSAITDPERRATMLQRIQRQVDRLVRLVEQLIDSARMSGQAVPLTPVKSDLVELAREAIDLATTSAADAQRVKLESPAAFEGTWDPARLEQVLTNLIGNALRYCPAPKPVTVRMAGDETRVVIEVIDQGIGIPREQLEHVFSPFFRASNAVMQHRGGLGLGLYITADLVRRHGGRISVSSELDQGTTFTVELPRRT